jgi:hypothetical protein
MTTNANLFEPDRKKKAHSKTHHKDAEAILRVLKDLWKMKQRGDIRGASKLLTKHNVSRLPVDIYLGFVEGKSYEDLTLDYASEVKPLLNKAKKERYGKQEPQAQTIEDAKAPLTIEDAPTAIDWEQRRYEIAKDVAVKLYCAYKEDGNDDYFEQLMDAVRDCDEYTTEEEVICGSSVYFANTLIKWLINTQQQ